MAEQINFLDPFSDLGFKRIFGRTENKSLLISFLNALLGDDIHVVDVEYKDKEFVPESNRLRLSVCDLLCKIDSGKWILVEMQNKRQSNFVNRTVLYVSQTILRQAERGREWDYNMLDTYCIAFMNFKDVNLDEEVRTDAMLCSLQTGKRISGLQHYVFLQLPYFTKKADECKTDFERWIFVLKDMKILNELPPEYQCPEFERLKEVADISRMTEDELIEYDRIKRQYSDTIDIINQERAEGRAEGHAEGHAEGYEEGIYATAKSMKADSLPSEMISKYTGLSVEEIDKL
jgi:predicted transposase/invertase (TIGR01784 family)